MNAPILLKYYYRLPRQAIGLLRFLLESYDGLAFMRTLDSRDGLVEVAWPASRSGDAEALLAALEAELAMQRVAPPAEVPPL